MHDACIIYLMYMSQFISKVSNVFPMIKYYWIVNLICIIEGDIFIK